MTQRPPKIGRRRKTQALRIQRSPAPEPEVTPAPPDWRVTPVPGPQMVAPAFWAGIAAGVLVGVPGTSNCACLWMLGCGALAVFFFHKQFGRTVFPNEAARLGALSGFFSAAWWHFWWLWFRLR